MKKCVTVRHGNFSSIELKSLTPAGWPVLTCLSDNKFKKSETEPVFFNFTEKKKSVEDILLLPLAALKKHINVHERKKKSQKNDTICLKRYSSSDVFH